jgi:threonine/homoserine/homoserine lactone efflux protein
MNLYSFVLTSVIIILLPGTGVIYMISTGITKGRKASVIAAIGCTAGIIPHLCISIVLSTLLFELNEQVFNAVKILGVFYLLYLGVGMIVGKTKLDFESEKAADRAGHMIRRGILINLLNQKLTVFFLVFATVCK